MPLHERRNTKGPKCLTSGAGARAARPGAASAPLSPAATAAAGRAPGSPNSQSAAEADSCELRSSPAPSDATGTCSMCAWAGACCGGLGPGPGCGCGPVTLAPLLGGPRWCFCCCSWWSEKPLCAGVRYTELPWVVVLSAAARSAAAALPAPAPSVDGTAGSELKREGVVVVPVGVPAPVPMPPLRARAMAASLWCRATVDTRSGACRPRGPGTCPEYTTGSRGMSASVSAEDLCSRTQLGERKQGEERIARAG